jgi:6-phosphogluconate dehydrogenase
MQFWFCGIGVMGHMLALNMERHGSVAGSISTEKVKPWEKYPTRTCRRDHGRSAALSDRRIMLMVPWEAVDAAIASLKTPGR